MSALRTASIALGLASVVTTTAIAQRVVLEVRPRPGDTLRVTLDHSIRATVGPRGAPDSSTTADWKYHIVTRNVVERTDTKGTFVLSIVDSVAMSTTGSLGASPFPGVDRGMVGLRVRLQVLPDGSATVTEGLTQVDPALRALLGSTPAVMPAKAVAVGESWTRDLPLPADGSGVAGAPSGKLTATFRLDSLTDGGDRAWISLRGRVESTATKPKDPNAASFSMSGTHSGLLLLDRRRGWLLESRATVAIESLVTTAGSATPLLVKVWVTQVMRTAPIAVRR